ncbi:hypothetical protein THASP1DRAFT_33199 [Thamnocephalis sphaerospora]|uniref:Root hair defective 3 GTP-binding protein-domain-containing protein n=1 Tax=Thamnocephalis sphaerospora TaxID=78915 RepID=A0A4V1IVR5_9FUNG|nr:hypothetical protein THASP1DRAFT_33199 [Thamnocephalis sphaerospora]|eukprot:RKP04979.1 hypothetical protein THASP1DRAFT_33199 [Thamnocephalis sphaerospora]
MADLKSVWANLPAAYKPIFYNENCFFDVEFAALPNKLTSPNEFNAAITQLRARFLNANSGDYAFDLRYWKLVSAGVIMAHMSRLWGDIIKYNAALFKKDNSSDTALYTKSTSGFMTKAQCFFAQNYEGHGTCFDSVIIDHHVEKFKASIDPLKKAVDSGAVDEGLKGKLMQHYSTIALNLGTALSSHGSIDVMQKKEKMRTRCGETIIPLFNGHLRNTEKSLVQQLSKRVQAHLEAECDSTSALNEVVDKEREKVTEKLQEYISVYTWNGKKREGKTMTNRFQLDILETITRLFTDRIVQQQKIIASHAKNEQERKDSAAMHQTDSNL